MTSAKKIKGKKLMDYQRENIDIEPVYQDIEIYSIHSINKDNLSFEVHRSSGTYVRSICRDLALKTNNGGCMKSLQRTAVGRFTIDMAQKIEEKANEMLQNGYNLITMSITGTAKAILVFKK